jgi:hypothetical protein
MSMAVILSQIECDLKNGHNGKVNENFCLQKNDLRECTFWAIRNENLYISK